MSSVRWIEVCSKLEVADNTYYYLHLIAIVVPPCLLCSVAYVFDISICLILHVDY